MSQRIGIGDSKCFGVFGRKLRDCKYCAKGAVGSKPEVCMRVWLLRVHHPPLLKAPATDRLGLPISTLRIMRLANPGANTAVCVIVGSSNVVAASLENIAHFRTKPDQKDPEKRKQVTLGVSCFRVRFVELWLMGKGFEQQSSASENWDILRMLAREMSPRDA